jgi:sulfur-oxidizing protein SoxY
MARAITRRQAAFALALLSAGAGAAGRARAQSAEEPDPWPDLARMFFDGRSIVEDTAMVSFDAPERAEDAALVPMSFSARLPAGDQRRVVKLTLVIDQNPAPLAAVFTLGEKAGDTRLSTRVRVNSYTDAHVVAELSDGSLHMAARYVKAAGGCSAPMVKSMDEALATLGQMKFRILPPTPEAPNEALVMIRHPNNSGLQMDQVTRLYTPARYVNKLAVYQGGDLVFSMAGGISIAEDPNFRFSFRPNGAREFRVEGEDTAGKAFSGAWPATRDGA